MLLTVGLISCGDDSAGTDSDDEATTESPPFSVATLTETFVDDSRPTDDPEGERNATTRTLETDIYVPEGEGPFPLIVHAHGFDGHAGKYSELLTTWAEAGYVVAAPTFPLTNDLGTAPGVLTDYLNQPADVAYVIDQMTALSTDGHPMLGDRIDADRIGVSGHSLGGITVSGLVFNSCCRDDRIDAALVMNSLPLEFDEGSYSFEGAPLMLSLSTGDPIIPYDAATTTYDEAESPKILVSLESDGHFEPYEDVASPHDQVIADTTTAFWDGYLLDDPGAADRLLAAVESDGLTTATSEL